ncbi:MAG: AsnC family protein [Rhodospirillaceae bacterium]
MDLTEDDMALIGALREGLPLCPRPYDALGAPLGLDGAAVRMQLARFREEGALARFGVVVRHDRLGYTSSAMVVWDVPDDCVDARGEQLAVSTGVGLSYRRDRRPPLWPYNLYAMIPGRSRDEVSELVVRLEQSCGLAGYPREMLFTLRCCKIAAAAYGRRA